jgi:hypothetical protein
MADADSSTLRVSVMAVESDRELPPPQLAIDSTSGNVRSFENIVLANLLIEGIEFFLRWDVLYCPGRAGGFMENMIGFVFGRRCRFNRR